MQEEGGQGVELFIMQVSLPEFFGVMQILEQQKSLLSTYSQSMPLVRERIEPTY
jgi:hypothetical protein